MFRGSVSPKSNFPALLEIGHPQKIQSHMTAALQNQHIVAEQKANSYHTCPKRKGSLKTDPEKSCQWRPKTLAFSSPRPLNTNVAVKCYELPLTAEWCFNVNDPMDEKLEKTWNPKQQKKTDLIAWRQTMTNWHKKCPSLRTCFENRLLKRGSTRQPSVGFAGITWRHGGFKWIQNWEVSKSCSSISHRTHGTIVYLPRKKKHKKN